MSEIAIEQLAQAQPAIETKLVDSKEVGLAVGLLIGKHFFKTEELHYGFWNAGQSVTLENLPLAQQQHTDFIISHIPEGTRTVLDVGAGAGKVAERLLALGLEVDCVSPSPFLCDLVRKALPNKVEIFPCRYEDVKTPKRYDLILFSESFQYMDLSVVMKQSARLLNPGGRVLLCDFFRREGDELSPLGGGHKLPDFYAAVDKSGFTADVDLDITQETAPTMQVFGSILNQVAVPIRDLVSNFLSHRHPYLIKYLKWQFKKRFKKLDRIYFSGNLNAATFAKFKNYRLIRLKAS